MYSYSALFSGISNMAETQIREINVTLTRHPVTVSVRLVKDEQAGTFDVITSSEQTRLQVYECENEAQAQETFQTIRDTLLDVTKLLANTSW